MVISAYSPMGSPTASYGRLTRPLVNPLHTHLISNGVERIKQLLGGFSRGVGRLFSDLVPRSMQLELQTAGGSIDNGAFMAVMPQASAIPRISESLNIGAMTTMQMGRGESTINRVGILRGGAHRTFAFKDMSIALDNNFARDGFLKIIVTNYQPVTAPSEHPYVGDHVHAPMKLSSEKFEAPQIWYGSSPIDLKEEVISQKMQWGETVEVFRYVAKIRLLSGEEDMSMLANGIRHSVSVEGR